MGADCVVGEGALLHAATLWRNVTVEAGARVDRAILCDGVIVRAG